MFSLPSCNTRRVARRCNRWLKPYSGGDTMDKYRGLEYFVATAHEGSFSAAARVLGVSVQAVAKLVTALENNLEVKLFDRTSQGMSLTSAGAGYLEECLPALEQLHAAEQRTKGAMKRSKGTGV